MRQQMYKCCFLIYSKTTSFNFESIMRLSIDVTLEQHQHLKALSALKGQSLKQYVLERTLPSIEAKKALETLENFLSPRMESAQNGQLSAKSVDQIFDSVLNEQ